MTKPLAAVSWSGGKDSCLAYHRASRNFDVAALITMFTEDGTRSRSHGLRPEVLGRQAGMLGLDVLVGHGSWKTYENEFVRVLGLAKERGVSHVIFGDILLQEHKDWVERVCGAVGLEAVEPLWRESTSDLVREFLATGGEAMIVAAKAALMDRSWIGRKLDLTMFPEFERLGVDPCGENGEYHTLVTNFPGFREPLLVVQKEILEHDGYWMLDMEAKR